MEPQHKPPTTLFALRQWQGKRAVIVVAVLFGLAFPSGATPITLKYSSMDVSLSKSAVISGEPLDIVFAFESNDHSLVHYSTLHMSTFSDAPSLCIDITDENGVRVQKRRVLVVKSLTQNLIYEEYTPSAKQVLRYPIHLQQSTRLAPGKYLVKVNLACMSISSGTGEEVFKGDVPPIALEILPYDKDKLAAVYAALVKEAEEAFRQPVKEWHGFDFPDVPPTVRSLLWSYGPDAVPFQVDFLYSPETGFRYWTPATIHAYSNIVEFATPEQVLKLAAITEDKGFIADTRSNAHYCRGLTWALEQLHEHGSDQIKALTEDVVKKYPNTLDPTNFGIGDQKFIQP